MVSISWQPSIFLVQLHVSDTSNRPEMTLVIIQAATVGVPWCRGRLRLGVTVCNMSSVACLDGQGTCSQLHCRRLHFLRSDTLLKECLHGMILALSQDIVAPGTFE